MLGGAGVVALRGLSAGRASRAAAAAAVLRAAVQVDADDRPVSNHMSPVSRGTRLGGAGVVALRGLSAGRASRAAAAAAVLRAAVQVDADDRPVSNHMSPVSRGTRLGGAGVVALHGLSAGRASRAAAAAAVLRAAVQVDADDRPMYVDLDAEGCLVCPGGAAALVARARLAPGPGRAGAALEPAPGAAGAAWRVVVTQHAAPHAELLLWPRKDVLERAAVPTLTTENKVGPCEYCCHRCDARFDAPNTLRIHLYLACRTPTALLFLSALLRATSTTPLDSGSAFRPYTSVSPVAPPPPPPPPPLAPAALEALATAWGRGAGGGAGHACVYCGRLYSRRYGLKIHLRTHTGYKPLRCPHCRRAFGDPSNLNKHVKLHGAGAGAGGRGAAHACSLCGKLLVRRRDLERHMRARHHPHTPDREV